MWSTDQLSSSTCFAAATLALSSSAVGACADPGGICAAPSPAHAASAIATAAKRRPSMAADAILTIPGLP